MKKCAHVPTSSEYRSRVWTQASGSIGLSHSHHAVSSGTSDHLFSRICIRGHIQCTELPVSGNQAVDYCPWAQLVQLRTWTPSSPSPCSTGEHEALGGAGTCLVGSVAIPGLPALPTLLHNRRPPLGFEQRPVTFYSYWRPLVVKIYILGLFLQGHLQHCALGWPNPDGLWTPGIWRLIFQFTPVLHSLSMRARAETSRPLIRSCCHLKAE